MGLISVAKEANAEVTSSTLKGNDYTLALSVNGTAPSGSEAVVTVKVRGSETFEGLEENGTIDLTSPKTIKIGYPCSGPAYLEEIKITPNSTFTADLTSTFDAKLNVQLSWGSV